MLTTYYQDRTCEKEKRNDWKILWSKRSINMDILCKEDKAKIFLELKRSNGFDVMNEGLSLQSFIAQYLEIREGLFFSSNNKERLPITSVYEIGCGSGANLFLFENDDSELGKNVIECGGIDYSGNLIEIAKRVLQTKDLVCDEANLVDTKKQYDAVLSNSVFSYFPDEEYAYSVLEKMYKKARNSIGIIDIHNIEKREDFIAYRKENIENYEERYKNLQKLFYSKQFFIDFAKEHNLLIQFTDSDINGY